MRLDECYTVRELLQLNEESAPKNEFKPKFGNGAKRGSSENDKAVKEILKNVQAYDNVGRTEKAKRKPEVEFEDYNKTTMDVNFEYEPGKEWKERVKKLATKGTESDMADYFDTKGNEKFYKDREKMSKDRAERNKNEREKGIVGRNNKDHKAKDYSDKTAFVNEEITAAAAPANHVSQFTHDPAKVDDDEGDISMNGGIEHTKQQQRHTVSESKPLKRLKFKNTVFLSESQVLAKVPDDYKIDENRFYMQDKTGTDYLVECKADPFGYVHMTIENKINKVQINEELEKIKRLSGYSYGDDNIRIDKTKIGDMSESINNLRGLLIK